MILQIAASVLTTVPSILVHGSIFSPFLNQDGLSKPSDGILDNIDIITGSQYNGLTTFASLPYVNCFTEENIGNYDIAILGAPFDTVSILLPIL